MNPVTCVLRQVVGERYTQSAWWGDDTIIHRSEVPAATFEIDDTWTPAVCDGCGQPYDGSPLRRGASNRRVWDTTDGSLHPGDMYFALWRHHEDRACEVWDNCAGPHLMVVLPNEHHWEIDSRASNCTLPADRLHRCWVRHGDPPLVTVDKVGLTCSAGAGSIASGGYHGFLRDGQLVLA